MSQSPKYIDPMRMAEAKAMLADKLSLSHMDRLGDLLINREGECAFEIAFEVDESGLHVIHGHINTTVQLKCQRCLQEMGYVINAEFHLSPVYTDAQAKSLPTHYEPLMLTENKVLLETLIEDEILLNLPLVAMHDVQECSVVITKQSSSNDDVAPNQPFKILAKFKDRNKH